MSYSLDKLKRKINFPTEFPPAEVRADLAIPCFRNDPKLVAKKVKSLKEPMIKKVELAGRYVNLVLDKKILAKKVLMEVRQNKDRYGWKTTPSTSPFKGEKILIEYSSPNIAKPLHIGHLRNTVLGHALENIYRAQGYQVLTENWLGDWGKQYGLLILAYQKWGDEKKLKHEGTKYLVKLYQRANKQAEKKQKI